MIRRINLFWCALNRADGKENFGDLLSVYIVNKLSKRKINYVIHPSMRRYSHVFKHYLTVGSILEVANKNSILWGSGIIRSKDVIKKAKFLAVRGPLTRKRLLELGYKVPERFGDPAILLPKLYPNNTIKKYKIGIIPHYVDYDEVVMHFKSNDNIKIINLLTTDVEKTLDEILECESIITSSLHGVIVPHSYGIPALWVKFSSKLGGDNVKFFDYFESVKIDFNDEIEIKVNELNEDIMNALLAKNKEVLLPTSEQILERQKDLLASNPFK